MRKKLSGADERVAHSVDFFDHWFMGREMLASIAMHLVREWVARTQIRVTPHS